jgi:hypothetical protein
MPTSTGIALVGMDGNFAVPARGAIVVGTLNRSRRFSHERKKNVHRGWRGLKRIRHGFRRRDLSLRLTHYRPYPFESAKSAVFLATAPAEAVLARKSTRPSRLAGPGLGR